MFANAVTQILMMWVILLSPIFCDAQHAIISTDQTRILYASLKNKVSIAVPGYRCDDLQLKAEHCSIKGSGCNYVIIPEDQKEAIFIISVGKSHRIIDKVIIPIKHIPDPVVKIAPGKNNTGAIITDGPIIVGEDGANLGSFFQIAGFKVTIISNEITIYQAKTSSSHFEPATLAAIAAAKPGDKLFVEEIQVIDPEGRMRRFNSISYQFR